MNNQNDYKGSNEITEDSELIENYAEVIEQIESPSSGKKGLRVAAIGLISILSLSILILIVVFNNSSTHNESVVGTWGIAPTLAEAQKYGLSQFVFTENNNLMGVDSKSYKQYVLGNYTIQQNTIIFNIISEPKTRGFLLTTLSISDGESITYTATKDKLTLVNSSGDKCVLYKY